MSSVCTLALNAGAIRPIPGNAVVGPPAPGSDCDLTNWWGAAACGSIAGPPERLKLPIFSVLLSFLQEGDESVRGLSAMKTSIHGEVLT
jgi:hypothetical protein